VKEKTKQIELQTHVYYSKPQFQNRNIIYW